jgi:DNA end-binding protein Ku
MAATVWRGHLAFGLVSFPVRLYRAARAEKIGFRRLYRPERAAPESEPEPEPAVEEPEPPRVARGRRAATPPQPEPEPEPERVYRTRNEVVAADADEQPVARSELVRGYEYEKGRYVVVEDEDLRRVTPQTSKEMQILEFVRLAEIDPIYFETSYYVRPEEAGERPYTLLFEALRETGVVGIAEVAMHRREHVVVVQPGRSGLIAHTMFYPDEIRSIEEFATDPSKLNPRELDLAKRLIAAMKAPFEPEKFRDRYRERLRELIDAKLAGRRIAEEPAAPRQRAEVIDILAALRKSLNAAAERKPAARVARPAKKRASS